jgi:predicted exporter
MRLSRLRSGEIVAGLGAAALVVALFLPWFDGGAYDIGASGTRFIRDGAQSGWSSLGWLALVPIVVAALCGLALVVATLTERTPALPLAIGVMTVP